MGIGLAKGKDRAVEAAKKAISSPLLETSIDGAQGVLMNITGGSNLSLYEVQEAADIVASAADKDLNMIFGSIINENYKDEIMITVIATGFSETELSSAKKSAGPSRDVNTRPQSQGITRREQSVPDVSSHTQEKPRHQSEDTLDIPTFLRNRNRR